MTTYVDSSALVKLVLPESETSALRAFLLERPGSRTTSALARTEVVSVAGRAGTTGVARARELLATMHEIAVSRSVLDSAADVAVRLGVRSLDAIHLATAQSLRQHLDVLVTYDRRMLDAAAELGLPVASPT